MKRILTMLLAMAMVFCLFACSEQEIEESKKKSTSTASNPTTGITVPTTQSVEDEKIQEATAIQLGDYKLSPTEVNYFYVDAINRYVEQYYYYIYFGYIRLDLTTPLNQQYVDSTTTWADFFMDMAVENIKSTYGLYDLAMKNDYTLNCDETAELTGLESYLRNQAEDLGYRNVDQMLKDTYGSGATLSSYMEY